MKNKKKLIAPSILSADLNHLEKEVLAVEKAGADWIHLDVMDGHFVQPITFGANTVKHIRSITSLPIDAHLMVQNPTAHIESFFKAGVSILSVHYEVFSNSGELRKVLKKIRSLGILAGLALKPGTKGECVFPFLPELDFVLVMTVEPGFSGQAFMPEQTEKIRKIQNELKKIKKEVKIEVDGGINSQTAKQAGRADIFVAGHFIFKSQNYSQAVKELKNAVKIKEPEND